MGPEDSLSTFLKRKDHLNVLRYIRAHKLQEPSLVLHHGRLLLGTDLSSTTSLPENARRAALEQISIAAFHLKEESIAELAMSRLEKSLAKGESGKKSTRYSCLYGLFLESQNKREEAETLYDSMTTENPSNMVAWKRKYRLERAKIGNEVEAMEALNSYLERNGSDVGAWMEMSKLCAEIGDYAGVAHCLEEVVLACPLSSEVHCWLGEAYVTVGTRENYKLARKHFAQSLELDSNNLRALFGLVGASSCYLEDLHKSKNAASGGRNNNRADLEEEDEEVAKELVKYGAEKLIQSYKGTSLRGLVEKIMKKQIGAS